MGKHKTQKQDEVMVEFMRSNQELARGFVKGDRTAAEAKWSQLTTDLNAIGPPCKDVNGWKKVWSDWKITIRRKLAKNKQETKATGGGPYAQLVVLPIEETIATICGLFEMVDGVGASTFGVPIAETSPSDPFSDILKREPTDIQAEHCQTRAEPVIVDIDEEGAGESRPRSKSVPQKSVPTDLQGLCAAQIEALKKVVETLGKMSAQQADYYRRIEEIKREELEVTKSIAEAVSKIAANYI
ncbi:uncharacterized protein LOC118749153 [Rhagoletis pomonella]|uniref:uncharacterized protein LOC118749153 n=1 Tax=Rhagoletis pomonella TaxID=28610 RepID=UPI0017864A79|nr:uncharacterized protein LOC118749153 [Rhagoletis pomonella]